MTKTRHEMKMSFKIHGRDMTFSRGELIKILEKYVSTAPIKKTVQRPIEGKWFEVDPETIDQSLFYISRPDLEQEKARKLILQAFDAVKIYPERYGKKFYTLIPRRHWSAYAKKTVKEIIELHRELGDHNADWVEQALEWAQRICNGETWERLCNKFDRVRDARFIIWDWKTREYRRVGGSEVEATYVESIPMYYDYVPIMCVPLIVGYNVGYNK